MALEHTIFGDVRCTGHGTSDLQMSEGTLHTCQGAFVREGRARDWLTGMSGCGVVVGVGVPRGASPL